MAVIYEIKERRVIPNWRDFKRTLQIGELGNLSSNLLDFNIQRIINDWNYHKNIGTAAELVNAAFVSEKNELPELSEAISFIHNNRNLSSTSLLDLTIFLDNKSDINTEPDSSIYILEKDLGSIREFKTLICSKTLFEVIGRTKRKIIREMHNPILRVELSRLYTIQGQIEKAERAMLTALHLAPDNRFVLRSATRFFIHTDQIDKALFYLKNSKTLKSDPWLISAHIATSSIINRFSPLIKYGEKIILSNKFQPNDLTELYSTLGTLEFNDGSFKKAKKLFNNSLLQPNDNTLAQIEWVSKEDSRFAINPFVYDSVINPFEAFALEHYELGNWRESFHNCMKWLLDTPFSKRPVLLGSYIAGSLLNDAETSILLCEVGLLANPSDPTILNNIIYELVKSNRIQEAKIYISQLKNIDFKNLPNESKVTIQATLGLVAFREENLILGKKLYELAILNAKRLDNDHLVKLAILNYTRELALAQQPEYKDYIDIVESMIINENQKDLLSIRAEILNVYF